MKTCAPGTSLSMRSMPASGGASTGGGGVSGAGSSATGRAVVRGSGSGVAVAPPGSRGVRTGAAAGAAATTGPSRSGAAGRMRMTATVAASPTATLAVILRRRRSEEPVVAPAAAPVRAPRAESGDTRPGSSAFRNPERPVAVAPAPKTPPAPVEAPAGLGTLRIDSWCRRCSSIGSSSARRRSSPRTRSAPGGHQLMCQRRRRATSIDVAAGQREIVVTQREVRPGVVGRRHPQAGVGSCRVCRDASGASVRDQQPGRFVRGGVPYFETFQVDYLAKNLRLKLPKDRQFNFTDPEGNADRLFVFHRDVENARGASEKATRRPRID